MKTLIGKNLIGSWNEITSPISKKSFQVDWLLFIANLKPAVRIYLEPPEQNILTKKLYFYGIPFSCDEEGYIAIANKKTIASHILNIDALPEPHARILGELLGYPICCCDFIERLGENYIDDISASYKRQVFLPYYRYIDPSCYLEGKALISHVPCSYTCDLSLKIARKAYNFLHLHKERLLPFSREIYEYFVDSSK